MGCYPSEGARIEDLLCQRTQQVGETKGLQNENLNSVIYLQNLWFSTQSYVTLLNYNQDGYKTHCRKYHEYKEWEKNRNQERFLINVEKTHNYDAKNMSDVMRIYK